MFVYSLVYLNIFLIIIIYIYLYKDVYIDVYLYIRFYLYLSIIFFPLVSLIFPKPFLKFYQSSYSLFSVVFLIIPKPFIKSSLKSLSHQTNKYYCLFSSQSESSISGFFPSFNQICPYFSISLILSVQKTLKSSDIPIIWNSRALKFYKISNFWKFEFSKIQKFQKYLILSRFL